VSSDTTPESNAATIVPVREKDVTFYGDNIHAAQAADETIYVPIGVICDALGLARAGQFERIRRNPVLAEGVAYCVIDSGGGPQTTLSLPLDMLPGWLFGINAERVKPELREKILRYQRECFRVLWDAFKGDVAPAAAAPLDLSPVEQALLLAEAVASMAREHLALEQRVTTIAEYTRGYIQQSRRQLTDHEDRLTALEVHLASGATISESQAAEIQIAVKNIAMLLIQQGQPNGFAQVWGELYRRYRVGAYRNLPAARFAEVRDWLDGWYGELNPSA
jgi:hypothetical protein